MFLILLLLVPWIAWPAANHYFMWPASQEAQSFTYAAAATLLVLVLIPGYEYLLGLVTKCIGRLDIERRLDDFTDDEIPKAGNERLREKLEQIVTDYATQNATGARPAFTAIQKKIEDALKEFSACDDKVAIRERRERLIDILDRLQNRIDGEYSDVASRTGWLLTGQAFLLGAFVAILNADHIGADARHWFSTGVATAGAVISFVLALSTSFGHALIEKLQTPRGAVERLLIDESGLPRAGVPKNHWVHRLGHFATRYLPVFAYIAWSCLTLFAFANIFIAQESRSAAPIHVLVGGGLE